MNSIENLIPDQNGNYLVVVLYLYDDYDKKHSFQIPPEYQEVEIIDINIRKLKLDNPIGVGAFFKLADWILTQFNTFKGTVFSYICSTEAIDSRHIELSPEEYRWKLFERLCDSKLAQIEEAGIRCIDVTIGPEGYSSKARIFYKMPEAPIVNLVINHLENKYNV